MLIEWGGPTSIEGKPAAANDIDGEAPPAGTDRVDTPAAAPTARAAHPEPAEPLSARVDQPHSGASSPAPAPAVTPGNAPHIRILVPRRLRA
jgi:hypothetical protein